MLDNGDFSSSSLLLEPSQACNKDDHGWASEASDMCRGGQGSSEMEDTSSSLFSYC